MKRTTKFLAMLLAFAMMIPAIQMGTVISYAEDTVMPAEFGQVTPIDETSFIENADSLANGVQAYFTENRNSFILENQQMSFEYALREKGSMLITSLKNKDGEAYIENTMDAFIVMSGGNGKIYASNSSNTVTPNLHRFGYYHYDARFEGQDFIDQYIEVSSITKKFTISSVNQVNKTGGGSTDAPGYVTGTLTSSDDPYMIFGTSKPSFLEQIRGYDYESIAYSADKYQYIKITMATDPGITSATFFYGTEEDGTSVTFSESMRVSFPVSGTGTDASQARTYMVPMYTSKLYGGNIDALRIDFTGSNGANFNITKLELVEVDTGVYPQGLQLNRDFLVYSDKMHSFTQFTTTQTVENIVELGVEVKIPTAKVGSYVVKADGTTYNDITSVVDWTTAEYVGFYITDVGVFGYIMPADNSGGTLTVTLEGDNYVITQTDCPTGGILIPSEAGMDVPNGNDFFMGQRLYTDNETTLDSFIAEAEIERNPLTAENFTVSEDSDGEFAGYDAIRGIYKFAINGYAGFNTPYYSAQNKQFKINFTVNGDDKDRDIWVMTRTENQSLECAVILDENEMMIPVPIQVGKNFSEAHGERNNFNLDDPVYGEAIIPMHVGQSSSAEYTFLNLYQNWGQYPLKQLSWIQYSSPYYHLSTGVSESNCITPLYGMGKTPSLSTLPDFRGMSSPLWSDQPQHNSCGNHKWLIYTNTNKEQVVTENTSNIITSYGPTYASVDMDYISTDGNIKVTYTHMEMPQTDENRTYYEMKYEVLGDVSIANFSTDFQFYSVKPNDSTGLYQRVGYLDTNNVSQVVSAKASGSTAQYVLGDKCPYFSFFDMDGATSTHNKGGYSNVAFLVYNSDFTIGGEKITPNFLINDLGGTVSISLNLGEVNLKAGDSFTINAILLPWGSQEMEGTYDTVQDQNVRDVRANTLLDPVKITTDATANNAEVVESAFLPRVKTTNGTDATFTISGGENNQTIRVDGFTKLTDPKIYELVGGEWKKIELCSALTPDINGDGHSYDGYCVYYDSATGTYSYSFVTTLKGDQTRTFKVEAKDDFDGWEITVADSAMDQPMNILLEGEDLINGALSKGNIGSEVLNPVAEEFDYVRYTNTPGKLEAYFYVFYDDEPNISGNYIVMKYRIDAGQKIKQSWIDFFCCTDSKSAGSANYNVGWNCISNDGQWHLLIIDIAARNDADFVREEDGSSKPKHLRVDMFNWSDAPTETCYMDIAYVGMSDSLSEIFAYDTNFVDATLSTGSEQGTKITAPTNVADITVTDITVNHDDIFVLPVKIANNTGISYLDIMPVYDKDKFTLMGVENGDVLDGLSVNGSHFVWSNTFDSDKDDVLINLVFQAKDATVPGSYDFGVKIIDVNNINGAGVNTSVTSGTVLIPEDEFVHGDVDGNGKVELKDVIALRRYIKDLDYTLMTSSVEVSYGADANCDGIIDTRDVTLLRQYIVNYNYSEKTSSIKLGPRVSIAEE